MELGKGSNQRATSKDLKLTRKDGTEYEYEKVKHFNYLRVTLSSNADK